jgi:hypothetical protein
MSYIKNYYIIHEKRVPRTWVVEKSDISAVDHGSTKILLYDNVLMPLDALRAEKININMENNKKIRIYRMYVQNSYYTEVCEIIKDSILLSGSLNKRLG